MSCAAVGGAQVACVPDGGLGARCRGGDDALARGECDEGAACDEGFCARRAPRGEPSAGGCAPGLTCVAGATRESRCAAPGAAGAACRVANGRRACDVGLRCERDQCGPPMLREGAVCGVWRSPPNVVTPACAEGLSCAYGACVRQGAANDSCVAANACAPGLACRYLPSDPSGALLDWRWRCVEESAPRPADGAAGGGCRPASPRCDARLICVTGGSARYLQGLTYEASGAAHCSAGLPAGTVDRGGVAFCAPGSLPRFDTRSGWLVCEAVGVAGEQCRPEDLGCDAPLECVQGVCGERMRAGLPCDEYVGARRCDDGLSCVAGACVRHGALGAVCRHEGAACDAGLRCERGVCARLLAIGVECRFARSECAPGVLCTPLAGALRCVREGNTGGFCRANAEPRCDEGLRCVGGRCVE